MTHGRLIGALIEMGFQRRGGEAAAVGQQVDDVLLGDGTGGDDVTFDAVAGGENDGLVNGAVGAEGVQGRGEVAWRNGQRLAHGEGGGAIVEPDEQEPCALTLQPPPGAMRRALRPQSAIVELSVH